MVSPGSARTLQGYRYVFEESASGADFEGARLEELRGKKFEAALDFLRNDVYGASKVITTRIGKRNLLYADFTASGRSLKCVEDTLCDQVLPFYGNTHTLQGHCGRQSTFYIQEARQIIKQFFNATHEDALIITDNGSTGAVHRLLSILSRSQFRFTRGDAKIGMPGGHSFKEDRFGSFECSVCQIRLKSEAHCRAHLSSELHMQRSHSMEDAAAGNVYRLVVFVVDLMNHHSSALPFQEFVESHTGDPDMAFMYVPLPLDESSLGSRERLKELLEAIRAARTPSLEVVPFVVLSAASNVTGIRHNVPAMNALVHSYDGVVLWDFAAVSLHAPIDLNLAEGGEQTFVDFAVLSPHKFLGCPGCPGLLFAKKGLLRNDVPGVPGGGTVFYVTPNEASYILNTELREEGGTPNIVGIARLGLVLQLTSQLPFSLVEDRERAFVEYMMRQLSRHRRIHVLGPMMSETGASSSIRLPVISFLIKYGNNLKDIPSDKTVDTNVRSSGGLYLHHNFVAEVLNDLFGIQARSGCACAGPYSQHLLGIAEEKNYRMLECLAKSGQEVFRPGFVRVSLHAIMNWDEVELIANAILWIADFGWKLLPLYCFVPETGEWESRLLANATNRGREWLSHTRLAWTGSDVQVSRAPTSRAEPAAEQPKKDPKKVTGAINIFGSGNAAEELRRKLSGGIASILKPAAKRKPVEKGVEKPSELAAVFARNRKIYRSVQDTDGKSEEPGPPDSSMSSALDDKEAHSPTNQGGDSQPLTDAGTPSPPATRAAVLEETAQRERDEDVVVRRVRDVVPHGQPDSAAGDGFRDSISTEKEKHPDITEKSTRQEENDATVHNNEATTKGNEPTAEADRDVVNHATNQDPRAQDTEKGSHKEISGLLDKWTHSQKGAPEDMGEHLKLAHDFVKYVYCSGGIGMNVLQRYAKSFPLPGAYADLLWFALPSDAFHAINSAEDVQMATPALVKEDEAQMFWDAPPVRQRPEDSWFEIRRYVGSVDCGDNDNKTLRVLQRPGSDLPSTVVDGSGNVAEKMKSIITRPMGAAVPPVVGSLPSNEVKPVELLDPTRKITISRKLRSLIGSAIRDFEMINESDKILLGISGGKDSLTMLHLLLECQRRSPVKFELACATVDPQTPEFNPKPLISYMEGLGVKYHFLSFPIIEMAKTHMNPKSESICAFCSRMKRGLLYSCMRKHGYNVLALGQHLDDICEAFVMSAFNNGQLNTMKAHYTIASGELRVCRPLVYIRELMLAKFARDEQLPVINDNCPACFAAPKERHRVKLLLAQQEYECPHLFANLLKTIKPLLRIQDTNTRYGRPPRSPAEERELEKEANKCKEIQEVLSERSMENSRSDTESGDKRKVTPATFTEESTDTYDALAMQLLDGIDAEDILAETVLTGPSTGGQCPIEISSKDSIPGS